MCEELHNNGDTWSCYHKPILTTNSVNCMKDRIEILKGIATTAEHLILEDDITEDQVFFSNMCTDVLLKSINSVYFDVNPLNISEIIKYNALINKELRMRDKPTSRSLEEKRCRLLQIMKNEYELKDLILSIEHSNPDTRAFYSVITALPCMFHGEMRIATLPSLRNGTTPLN